MTDSQRAQSAREFMARYGRMNPDSYLTLIRDAALPFASALERMGGRRAEALARPRVQFLILHHVFPDEETDFRRLLSVLAEGHRFISYSEAVRRIWEGVIDAPYLVITFDDGFKSCLTAARIMGEFGARGCFFISPTITGETDERRIAEFCRDRLFTPPVEFLSWDDVEALLATGHEIGSHTLTHPNMVSLNTAELEDEIGGSFRMLEERIGEVRHFSWPLGRWSHFSAEAARIVFESGYQTCASAERGCHVAQTPPRDLCIRRTHVVSGWPVDHMLFFLSVFSRRADQESGRWPPAWRKHINGVS